jgi:hypothetical protein
LVSIVWVVRLLLIFVMLFKLVIIVVIYQFRCWIHHELTKLTGIFLGPMLGWARFSMLEIK